MILTLFIRLKKLWRNKKKSVIRKVFGTLYSVLWRAVVFALVFGILFLAKKYGPSIREDMAWAKETIDKSSSDDFKPKTKETKIYDKEGNLLIKFSDGSRASYLTYEDIPEDVKNAFIAIEDKTFWENPGFDLKGIMRVVYRYMKTGGEEAHGASTITQQLVRMTYLTQEKSIHRKVKELFLSYYMTEKYSKEDILTFYINKCCFGNNLYGIKTASEQYFGKEPADLTIGETAYLCALPNRPSYFDPWKTPENAIDRKNKILSDMTEYGLLSEEKKEEGIKEDTVSLIIPEKTENKDEGLDTVSLSAKSYMKSYAVKCLTEWKMRQDGFVFQYEFDTDDDYDTYKTSYNEAYETAYEGLSTAGFTVQTSLSLSDSVILQNALDGSLSKFTETGEMGFYDIQGAMTLIDNKTGFVTGIVGGRSEEGVVNYLNRACDSFRQPGSSIKPLIVYTPGLMRGYEPESVLTEVSVKAANEGKGMTGSKKMSLRSAVEQSKNGCAYYLFNEITPVIGISFLHKMDFSSIVPSDTSLPAALGGLKYGTNTVEMAGAYHALYDTGNFTAPTCLISVKDETGKEQYQAENKHQVYFARESAQMIDVMKGVIERGTAKAMKWDMSMEAAGKTGTTNDGKDGWFCGLTPYYTLTVWVGADTPHAINGLYGGTYPMKAWKSAMTALLDGKAPASFNLSHENDKDTIYHTIEETKEIEREEDKKLASLVMKTVLKERKALLSSYYNAKYENVDEVILQSAEELLDKIYETEDTETIDAYISGAEEIKGQLHLKEDQKKLSELIEKAEGYKDSLLEEDIERTGEDNEKEPEDPSVNSEEKLKDTSPASTEQSSEPAAPSVTPSSETESKEQTDDQNDETDDTDIKTGNNKKQEIIEKEENISP